MSRAHSKPTKNRAKGSEAEISIEQCLLVQDEIWRIVSNAARTEACLPLWKQAQKIAGGFPAADVSLQSIADALVYAAIDRGVAIEVVTPAPRQAIPGFLSLVGKKRKQESDGRTGPTFASVPIPAAT